MAQESITRPTKEFAFMHCHELAQRIEAFHPGASAKDVARLCLLLANSTDDAESLRDDQTLTQAWRDISLRLQAATDQHAAMTAELETLSRSSAGELGQEQIWTLLRALKVQSQVLQFYLGAPLPV
jgi:predicted component of type VI protein secretion system